MTDSTKATKEDAQYLEAGLNCAVRLRRIRDKGTADLMQYEHYNIAMADEIERLRAAIADVRSTAEGAVEWCNATASKTPFAQGQENHARLILEDLKKHGF